MKINFRDDSCIVVYDYKKETTQENLGRQRNKKCWRVQKKRKKSQTHSTMSETKAAFAKRTEGALEIVLYQYMENYTYMYFHKLSQFFTTLILKKIAR